ncbi:MAG: FRG domain-containing protein [Ramlibacter sp.]
MYGHYWGEAFASNGQKLGTVQTFLDPDRSTGYLTFVQHATGASAVAQFAARQVDSNFELAIVKNTILEDYFLVATEHRAADDLNVAATFRVESNGSLVGTFKRQDGANSIGGRVELLPVRPLSSEADTVFTSWTNFKAWLASHPAQDSCLYRGQSSPHPLSSTFHRTGRVDLVRFITDDLPVFGDYLDTTGGRQYDVKNPTDRGALIGIAQHYGFPSPLLDWTRSPYVAAFFALSPLLGAPSAQVPARIFRLTEHFCKLFPVTLNRPGFHGGQLV